MKIKYKNIRGKLIKKDRPCYECCFSSLINCVPLTMYKCTRNIFKKDKAQIFKL